MTDQFEPVRIIRRVQSDEITPSGGAEHVAVSFEEPVQPPLRCLGELRILRGDATSRHGEEDRFYQASTSELSPWFRKAAEGNQLFTAQALRGGQALRY